jgi:phosphoserine aminotransferase
MKIHNFSAGPSILPQSVMQEAAQACTNFNNSGLSLLEMSHRSKDFEGVIAEAEALVRELYGLDDSYGVIFMTGGASTQFTLLAMNLLNNDATAAYANTGVWAAGALKAAKEFGTINVVASSEQANYNYIPKDYTVPDDSAYFHYTTNNTIYGTQSHVIPDVNVPLIADMSSDIFSRQLDATKFGLIYAGAQKNMGAAGTTLVIVKKELLGKVSRKLPVMFDYRTFIEKGSMHNTPPVFPIYVSMLTLRWIKAQGLAQIEANNFKKQALLYKTIDENPLFKGTVAVEDRSWMNVNFVTVNPAHEAAFTAHCKATGISGLPGHRSVGGFRASIYNALPLESVAFLVEQMNIFAERNA